MKKIYVIWIWWIWISAIARYYIQNWYQVYGSDKEKTELIKKLQDEWIDIYIWERPDFLNTQFEKVIYTEALSLDQSELLQAKSLNIPIFTYPQSLAEISNTKKLISIAGSHGKSTTTSFCSLILKNSPLKVNAVIWSILKEFDGKNCYFSNSDFFVIEACEYKRSFLHYTPTIWIIVNIDLDHLDYYKDLDDYIDAFHSYINNIRPWWYAILNGNDTNSQVLLNKRNDISYIKVFDDYFENNGKKTFFPNFTLQVPWNHISFDAKIAFTLWILLWVYEENIINTLENYTWIWRRSEIVGYTKNNNLVMSDYGHHPTEIQLTLKALKNKYYDKKVLVVFQPHQYNRTIELLEWFKNSFQNADILIIPNIYESRDSQSDKEKMNGEKFTQSIPHPNKIWWDGILNTTALIKKFDANYPWELLIILLWAGNVDDIRYKILNQ